MLYVSGWRSSVLVFTCRLELKRVAEVEEASAGLQEGQDCKESCPVRQQRVLHVSGWRSSVLVFTRRRKASPKRFANVKEVSAGCAGEPGLQGELSWSDHGRGPGIGS